MNVSRILLTLLSISTLLACAASNTKPEIPRNSYDDYVAAELAEPIDKVTSFYVDSWNSLDKSHLILWINGHKPDLLTPARDCPDLTFT